MNLILLIAYVGIGIIYCMEVIPERCDPVYFNKKYLKYGSCKVMRYSRTSKYYVNINGQTYHTWGGNATLDLIFNEHLHNEYRRSFIELHYKNCEDLIIKDEYIGVILRERGINCPIPPGEFKLENITIRTENFPYVFPFFRGRVDFIVTASDSKEIMLSGGVYFTFKQNAKKSNLS